MSASALDNSEIENELVIFLRNSDIFSITERGVTTKTDTLSGDGTKKIFDLTETNPKNVRSITVDTVELTEYEDYTVNYSTAKVTFTTAPSDDTDNIEIEYDYGTGDKIYPDFPRTDLKIGSYPRVAVSIISIKTDELGLGAKANISDILISLSVYANGRENLNSYLKNIRESILKNKNNFHYLTFVTVQGQGPMINEPARADKILTKTLEIRALFNVEEVDEF
jgi:hypothetical protein